MREWGSRERTTGDNDNWCLPRRRGRGDCLGLRWRRGRGTSRSGGVSDEGATVVIVTKAGSGGFFVMGNGEARTRCDRLRALGGGGTRSSGVRSSDWEGWALVTMTTRRRPPKRTAWPRSPPLQLLLPPPRKTKTMTMMSPRLAATRKRSELVGGESLTFSSLLDSGMPEAVLLVNMVPWGKKYSCCSHPALTRLGSIFLGHFL